MSWEKTFKTLLDVAKLFAGAKFGESALGNILEPFTKGVAGRVMSDEAWRDVMRAHWGKVSKLDPDNLTPQQQEWIEEEFEGISSENLKIYVQSAKNLIREHSKLNRRKDGSEAIMMHSFAEAWKHLSIEDETGEADLRLRNAYFYGYVGTLKGKAFKDEIDALRDDKVRQWFIRLLVIGKEAYGTIEEWAGSLLNRALDALVGGDYETTQEKLKVLLEESVSRTKAVDHRLAQRVNRDGNALFDKLEQHRNNLIRKGW